MPRYLVTGGAGFIGSHLTDKLIEQGHDVIIYDDLSVGTHIHPQAYLIQADVRDESELALAFENIDGCFHLAAIPSVVGTLDSWRHDHDINFVGTLNVLRFAAESKDIPVVFTSSCAVYGNNQTLPLHEQLYIQPISAYGCDKLASEQNAFYMSQSRHLPTLSLRLFNVYGPRQNPKSPYSGVISKFIDALSHNQRPIIYGDGEQTRDFVYVADVVQCLIKAMKDASAAGNVINISTGQTITILNLAQKIASIMKTSLDIDYQQERVFDVKHSCGSTKYRQSRGFIVSEPIDSGLEKTIQSMRESDG